MTAPVFAGPRGGEAVPKDMLPTGKRSAKTVPLQEAIDRADAGDTVMLVPGVYDTPVVVRNKGRKRGKGAGSFDNPLRIVGSAVVTLNGNRNLVRPQDHDDFDDNNYAFIKILDSTGVVLENLTIQNVWPAAIYIGDSQEIGIRRVNIHGSTYAIYARTKKKSKAVSDLLIEHCAWVQNTDIWQGIYWDDIHHPPFPRRELDGDFFRGMNVKGDVVIRRNSINHAFNGVHFFASDAKDGNRPATVNTNVWVYENTFSFIRDNAVEAERSATNWWIWGNLFYNVHKWLAFEKNCTGGWWNIFSNRGFFDRKPGPPDDPNNGGAVFKMDKAKKSEGGRGPVNVFHNSWYLRSTYIKRGRLRGLKHFNNIVEYPPAEDIPTDAVSPGRKVFGGKFLKEWGSSRDYSFRNDLSNKEDYLLQVLGHGGTVAHEQPVRAEFAEPQDGFFHLYNESPALKISVAVSIKVLPVSADPGQQRSWKLPAEKNLGAVDGVYNPKQGPDIHLNVYTPKMLKVPAGVAAYGPPWCNTP